MLRFFHGYHPEVWDAQVKRGLVNDNDGVRYCQSITIKDYLKFNNLASRDGAFYKMLANEKRAFYIDRLQGGTYFEGYDYDFDLLEHYIQMLGEDNFYGFQFHEWCSNYKSDIGKLSGLPKDTVWTEKTITDEINRVFKMPYLFVESMSAAEMAEYGNPTNAEAFLKVLLSHFAKRTRQYKYLLPVDSCFLAYALEIADGVKRFAPEIGAQTPYARMQICYARGMARAHGKSFGTYYEPWGGNPFSTCSYHKEGRNEWGIGDSSDFPFVAQGENGGSSRSLQERLYIYSYMNNAEFMSEEWGLCNNFYDWNDFELSPYGLVNLRFSEFRRKYTDVGEKIVPVAVVLNEKHIIVDDIDKRDTFCGFELEGERREALKRIKDGIFNVFCTRTEMLGNARHQALLNSDVPDAVDMLNFTSNGALNKYRYLVDLTESDCLKKYDNVIPVSDVQTVLKNELPCYVDGGLLWMVNEKTSGGYYLTVFNNSGVSRSVAEGETLDKNADKTVTLTFKGERCPEVCDGKGTLSLNDGVYKLTVPAGSWCLIKF